MGDFNGDGKIDSSDSFLSYELSKGSGGGGGGGSPSGDGCNGGCLTIIILGFIIYLIVTFISNSY